MTEYNIRCSTFICFFFDLTGRSAATGWADPPPAENLFPYPDPSAFHPKPSTFNLIPFFTSIQHRGSSIQVRLPSTLHLKPYTIPFQYPVSSIEHPALRFGISDCGFQIEKKQHGQPPHLPEIK
jgi:hypothetical protein